MTEYQDNQDKIEQVEDRENKVTLGTKIKVVTALMVVGFAGYVANWVQQPTDINTDVFNLPTTSQSSTQTQSQQNNAALTQPTMQLTQALPPVAVVSPAVTAVDPAQAAAVPQAPEQLYTGSSTAPPAHFAAQNMSPSLGYPAETLAAEPQLAPAMSKGEIASSGPEDYLYAGIFGLILFLNRKKLAKSFLR